MTKRILGLALVALLSGMLSACISGKPPQDTYVGRDGKTTVIESDKESCQRSCNQTYSRCMDSSAAETNSGVNGAAGMVGASGECRTDLHSCLKSCKGQ